MYRFITRLRPAQATLGIEITDYCIKLVELMSTRKQEIIVQKYYIEKLPEQVVVDGRIKDPAHFTLILQRMMAKLDIRTKKVHLVLPSELIMVRFLKLPDISHKDLTKLVDFEMKNNIHLPFDSPVYDFTKLKGNEYEIAKAVKTKHKKKIKAIKQVEIAREEAAATLSELDQLFADPQDVSQDVDALQCDVMLVAAPKELITEYEEVCTAASLQPLSMEFKALSLFRVLEHSNMANTRSTVLVIDINGHLSDVSIFHDRQLKITRSIPLDFTLGAGVSKVDEEQELFPSFVNQDDNDFINICNDLGFELERLMNFYRYTLNNRDHQFTRILVAGDVPRLQELSVILAERMHLDIVLMNSDRMKSTIPNFDQIFPSIAVPIGLALRGNNR